MKTLNSDKIKIGAWIDRETKRRADIYRAISGKSLQDIYETALNRFLDLELPQSRFPVSKKNDLEMNERGWK